MITKATYEINGKSYEFPLFERVRQHCNHLGCFSHRTHPCEGCGQMNGYDLSKPKYYTPEMYKEITGEELDYGSPLKFLSLHRREWIEGTYYGGEGKLKSIIHFTGQPKPPIDYKGEEN